MTLSSGGWKTLRHPRYHYEEQWHLTALRPEFVQERVKRLQSFAMSFTSLRDFQIMHQELQERHHLLCRYQDLIRHAKSASHEYLLQEQMIGSQNMIEQAWSFVR